MSLGLAAGLPADFATWAIGEAERGALSFAKTAAAGKWLICWL